MKPFDNKYVKRDMTMHELTKRTGSTARQVRYLIAEGFVPPPTGGRANAVYGDAHLLAIERYQCLRDAGFSPASIRLLLESQTGVPFEVIPGVSIVVTPDLIGEDVSLDELGERIQSILANIFSKPNQ